MDKALSFVAPLPEINSARFYGFNSSTQGHILLLWRRKNISTENSFTLTFLSHRCTGFNIKEWRLFKYIIDKALPQYVLTIRSPAKLLRD